MRLTSQIKGQWIIILVDTGNTHNFMDIPVVTKTTSPMTGFGLEVRIVDGSVKELKGYTFGPNLYVLILGGCDKILGVQWLSILGFIQWDFCLTYVLGLYYFINWPKGY